MLVYSMRRFFWYQIYVSSTLRSQSMNFLRSPVSILAAIAQESSNLTVFGYFYKKAIRQCCLCYICGTHGDKSFGTLVKAIWPSYPEISCAARRARTRDRHIYWIFKFSIASILESASTYQSTPVNLFSKHKLINFTQTGLSKSCAARRARTRDRTNKPTIYRNND